MRAGISGRSLAAVAMLVLAGCGGVPESQNIRLDVAGPVAGAPAALSGTLQILPFDARGVLADRRLVYRSPQGERKQSASILWEETPQDAAPIVMAEQFRAAGLARVVLAPDHPGNADYFLSARIDRFELVDDAAGGDAVVELDATATKGNAREVILTGDYCAREPRQGEGAEAVAQAFDRAYSRVLGSLTHDLVRAMQPGALVHAGTPC